MYSLTVLETDVGNQGIGRAALPLKALGKNLPLLFPSFWLLLASLAFLGFLLPHISCTATWASVVTRLSYVSVSPHMAFLFFRSISLFARERREVQRESLEHTPH